MEIPLEAMPVVELLRRDTEIPSRSQLVTSGTRCVKILSAKFCHFSSVCPMGYHPDACGPTPISRKFFGYYSDFQNIPVGAFAAFYLWWDYLLMDEAAEALHLIWDKPFRQLS